jgi:hypothetical protein
MDGRIKRLLLNISLFFLHSSYTFASRLFLFLNVLMLHFFGLSDTEMEDKRLQKCPVK